MAEAEVGDTVNAITRPIKAVKSLLAPMLNQSDTGLAPSKFAKRLTRKTLNFEQRLPNFDVY